MAFFISLAMHLGNCYGTFSKTAKQDINSLLANAHFIVTTQQ